MIKKIILLIVICLLSYSQTSHAGSLELKTYFPAPEGAYDRILLVPQGTLPTSCVVGTLMVEESTSKLLYCHDTTFSGTGTFQTLSTVWALSGTNLYPAATIPPESEISSDPRCIPCVPNPKTGKECLAVMPTWCNGGTDYTFDPIFMGIGTSTPLFKLTLDNDGGILATGTFGAGVVTSYPQVPANLQSKSLPAQARFIWYPHKAAFRAVWDRWGVTDDTKIGDYSVAFGDTNTASNTATTVSGLFNIVNGEYGTVAGGTDNIAGGQYSTVTGGNLNTTAGQYAVVSGSNNQANSDYDTIGGGLNHISDSVGATIGGGSDNIIKPNASYSTISGGKSNTVQNMSAISDGTANYTVIGGGLSNTGSSGNYATIGGGNLNQALGAYVFIGGGKSNSNLINPDDFTPYGNYSVIAGGSNNTTSGDYTVVNGGFTNNANGNYTTILGGSNNTTTRTEIGETNSIPPAIIYSGNSSVIAGGSNNITNGGSSSTIFGGYSVIAGGDHNSIASNYSWVGGRYMGLANTAEKTFIWGYSDTPVTVAASNAFILAPGVNAGAAINPKLGINETAPTGILSISLPAASTSDFLAVTSTDVATPGNVFIVKNNGYIGIGQPNPAYPLQFGAQANGAYLTVGGVWTTTSSRSFKDHIKPLDTQKAIETIQALQPVTYNYKVDQAEHHVGFIAEEVPDLVAAAGRKSLDPMPVTAVLTAVLKEQKKELQAQDKTLDELDSQLQSLKADLHSR